MSLTFPVAVIKCRLVLILSAVGSSCKLIACVKVKERSQMILLRISVEENSCSVASVIANSEGFRGLKRICNILI